ncbi:hypothetical protein [Candidatus Poriferisocius sp.]|uniref:hypothetical protein n=1 Tax=Candidatus Poriferisocius sp. TaxID=3101276 RepID=UPI003B52478A
MSVELISVLIAVVAVGATLAGLTVSGQRAIRAELAAQRRDFTAELAALRRDFTAELAAQRQEITELREQISELRERMAHLAGLLDGLREAIAFQRGAA